MSEQSEPPQFNLWSWFCSGMVVMLLATGFIALFAWLLRIAISQIRALLGG